MRIETVENKQLKLTNDGELELFFLGVGSAFTKRQHQTNLLVIKGKHHVLIDCGTKCSMSLYKLGLSITDIDNFLITHSHSDHIGGLEEAALMGRYFTKKKPNMFIDETYQHILWDMSLRGGCAYNEEEARDMLAFSDFFNVIRPSWLQNYSRETLHATAGHIDLKMIRTKHIPDSSSDWKSSFWSCGVIIDDRILFTSDTRFDFELVDDFDKQCNFEAIFHDCQFFTGGVHASIEELNQFPPETKSRMFLTHYGDNWEEYEDKVDEYGFAGFAREHVHYIFD